MSSLSNGAIAEAPLAPNASSDPQVGSGPQNKGALPTTTSVPPTTQYGYFRIGRLGGTDIFVRYPNIPCPTHYGEELPQGARVGTFSGNEELFFQLEADSSLSKRKLTGTDFNKRTELPGFVQAMQLESEGMMLLEGGTQRVSV